MRPTVILAHLAFAAALAIVSATVTWLMIRVRVLDVPDGRKAHARPVPKGGGVGIVAAWLLGIAVIRLGADTIRLEPYVGAVIASCLIAAVAFADDLRDWPFAVKLAAQLAAGLAAIAGGLVVDTLHIPYVGAVPLGWLGPPLTLAWILLATNALNFIDGLDGLAGGCALIASGCLAAVAADRRAAFAYVASLSLAAGIAGFLPFNFPRARIFMGDVGSQFCGFMLALLGVAAARFGGIDMSILIVPMPLAPILWDVVFTLARRAVAGETLTRAHRGHLYQLAHRAGMDSRAITYLYWAMTGWGALCCAVFTRAASGTKVFIPLASLVPPLAWTAASLALARRRGVL